MVEQAKQTQWMHYKIIESILGIWRTDESHLGRTKLKMMMFVEATKQQTHKSCWLEGSACVCLCQCLLLQKQMFKERSNLELVFICTRKLFMGRFRATGNWKGLTQIGASNIHIYNLKQSPRSFCDEFRPVQPKMLLGSDSGRTPFRDPGPPSGHTLFLFQKGSAHT